MYEDTIQRFIRAVRDVPDFPKPGVVFKDLSRVWADPSLCREVVQFVAEETRAWQVEAVAGIESRGFLIGLPLAMALDVPFVLIRKQGKLPGAVFRQAYSLEYGEAVIEVQQGAFKPEQRVLVHDDVLATGGTAAACSELIRKAGAKVVGWSFLVELTFLFGRDRLASGAEFARPLLKV
jgi:adenine phosphoribosyltransferase